MATNFADLASHYWGRMRHWERKVGERDLQIAQQADYLARERYRGRELAKMSDEEWDSAVYSIECELVDTDRRRSVFIGRQQFAERMHDSCCLQAIMRDHKPTGELTVTLDPAASRGLAAMRKKPTR